MIRYIRPARYWLQGKLESMLLLSLVPLLKLSGSIYGPAYREWIRKEGNEVRTAVVTFRHKDNRQVVVIPAMIHNGSLEYYARIQGYLDALDATHAGIVEEGIINATPQQEAQFFLAERRYVRYQRAEWRFTKDLCELLGLRYQTTVIARQIHWISRDLTLAEIAKDAARKGFPVIHPDQLLFRAFRLNARVRPLAARLANKYFFELTTFQLFEDIMSVIDPRIRQMRRVKMTRREEIAFKNIVQELNNRGVVGVPWGGQHYAGFKSRLQQIGFYPDTVVWETVYRIK